LLREEFVHLHGQPLLENLLESVQKRYPGANLPPLPKKGKLNLAEVLNSRYFFS
jgi:DNA-directed RNA polymerase